MPNGGSNNLYRAVGDTVMYQNGVIKLFAWSNNNGNFRINDQGTVKANFRFNLNN